MLNSREVFTDTCFSHSYVTLFPCGVASFWYMLLFISDHCTIPLMVGLLETTVRTRRDMGNWSLASNPLRHPNPYSQERCPVPRKTCLRNLRDGRHGGDCYTTQILGKVKCYSDISIRAPMVPAPCLWETLAQKAALAPMGKALPVWKWNFMISVSGVQQESRACLELEPVFFPSQVMGESGKGLQFNQQWSWARAKMSF